jgi:hypothetical protein
VARRERLQRRDPRDDLVTEFDGPSLLDAIQHAKRAVVERRVAPDQDADALAG